MSLLINVDFSVSTDVLLGWQLTCTCIYFSFISYM